MEIREVNTMIALQFNKLSMNFNTHLLLLNFNIRSSGANFDTFNCFTNLSNKKIYILSFLESLLNDNNKNLCTVEGYDGGISPMHRWRFICTYILQMSNQIITITMKVDS